MKSHSGLLCTLLVVAPDLTVNNTDLLTPLKVAVTTIQPEADDWTFARKPALMEP